jgi:hypothetical protein
MSNASRVDHRVTDGAGTRPKAISAAPEGAASGCSITAISIFSGIELWRKSKPWKGSSRAMTRSVGITASALHLAERRSSCCWVISYEREVPGNLVIVRETIARAPGHRSGIACPRGRRRAREAPRVPGRRDDRRPGPQRGRMRLFVFRCPGPSPVVTERSGESRAQAGALVVIHPKNE